MPRQRSILASAVAAALTGCTTHMPPPPQPPRDIVTYVGQRDPAYEIAQALKDQQLRHRQQVARFQEEARHVHERVAGDPNFGGFILRWTPEPHAVVMFTGDAEARLRRYTSDPRFKAQRVELTLPELERMKDGMGEQLSRLGLRCFSVDGDEEHNSVTVGAPADQLARIRAAISAGQVKPPPKLRLKEEGCAEFRPLRSP